MDHLIQAVLIFASVFLAFWLNDYRIAVSERQATERAVEAVISEVTANREILRRWAPYHGEMAERVLAWLENEDRGDAPFSPYDYIDERGIFREILTYDSWDYLRQGDVRLDLDVRLSANRVFRQQEYVDRAVRATVEFLGSRELYDADRSYENAVIFYRHIADLHGQQVAMLESYNRFLEEVRAR
ncbi:MAG: hypothetical protein EA422_00495 [Gemmatimonadales bacterium]|nr:MAG: hypothetical protein EA422_00495 [Gemmatimonadales bacterium]